MKQQKIVSLGIVGKESMYPFSGVFSAVGRTDVGVASVVGRIHDADIRRDFEQTIHFSKELSRLIGGYKGSLKGLFRSIWDWYHRHRSHSQIICLVVQVVSEQDELWLSMSGTSGVWGLHQEVWYPLVADGSALIKDSLAGDYPMAVNIEPFPERVVVVPNPSKNQLPTSVGMNKYVFEVSDVD